MTTKEAMDAIEQLKINSGKEPLEISGNARRMIKYFEALATASEALEKQIPKEIHKYANGEIHCPSCDCNLTGGFDTFKYCIECGQKIREGEEDET